MLILSTSQLGKASDAFDMHPLQDVLIKGNVVKPEYFTEVRYIKNNKGEYCSATVVGKFSIMTAAHCITNSRVVTNVNGKPFIASCEAHPAYDGRNNDIAMCKTTGPIMPPYASLVGSYPKMGDKVMLSGYGCTRPDGTGGNDGILRIGSTRISRMPFLGDAFFYTYDQTAICSGDSGGPAFVVTPDMTESHHWVLGINSRGDMQHWSILTAVFYPPIRDFVKSWSKTYDAKVCGINRECDEFPLRLRH